MYLDTNKQQQIVVKALMSGPKTTDDLRVLGVFSPAPRILELRDMGLNIKTTWIQKYDRDGYHRRMGLYHLVLSNESSLLEAA
mgnify:CR=1 FL=1